MTDQYLVFTGVDGHPLDPDRLSCEFRRPVERHDPLMLSPHGLRHTSETLALRAGVHPKVVQERLGHSTIAITIDAYSDVTAGLQREAAETLAGLIARNGL